MPIETIILRILAAIAIAALFFILLRSFKLIFTRLIFGAYSMKYIKYFKKVTKTSPYPYCHKEDIPTLLAFITNKQLEKCGTINDADFRFEDVPGYITFKEIKKIYGRPECFNIGMFKGNEIRLAGYSCHDYNAPLDIIYYFTNYGLLLGEYQYKSQNTAEKSKILIELLANITFEIPVDFHAKYISGNHTIIYITDNGFSLSVKYLNTIEYNRIMHK